MAKTRWSKKKREQVPVREEIPEIGRKETETVVEEESETVVEEETETVVEEENCEEDKEGGDEEDEEVPREENEEDEAEAEEKVEEVGEVDKEEVKGEDKEEADGSREDERSEEEIPDVVTAQLPNGMYFQPSEYKNKMKISTRCYIRQTLDLFEGLIHPLTAGEKEWFANHPQFKHIFHMPMSKTHMSMGMWMLLLRTARIETKSEAWFVVNGTPIRCSLREHALISGFNCKRYENPDYERTAGNDRFWKKHFRGLKAIRMADVRDALEAMVPDRTSARLKMAVLYLICSVLDAPTKTGKDATRVKPFLLRAVDNLNFCTKFSWGRWTFENMLGEIEHTVNHFKGAVSGVGWVIPGFVIPLEILVFEAISKLSTNCREEYRLASSYCPRMCKSKFTKAGATGFALHEINHFLGDTKDIDSVIPTRSDEEKELLAAITEECEDEEFRNDPVFDSWMHGLRFGRVIEFHSMYLEDVQAREGNVPVVNPEIVDNEVPQNPSYNELVHLVKSMKEDMISMKEEIVGLKERVSSLEEEEKVEVGAIGTDAVDEVGAFVSCEQEVGDSSQPEKNKNRGKRKYEFKATPALTRAKAKAKLV